MRKAKSLLIGTNFLIAVKDAMLCPLKIGGTFKEFDVPKDFLIEQIEANIGAGNHLNFTIHFKSTKPKIPSYKTQQTYFGQFLIEWSDVVEAGK